jgi:hypothetical protein
LAVGWQAAALTLAGASATRAQSLDGLLQPAVPSFDTQFGLTDIPRTQPGGAAPAIHIDGLSILADLTETTGYDSNVDGLPHGPGTSFLETAPSLSVAATGPRGRFGLALTLDDIRDFALPQQDRTDWTVSLGTSYALGRDTLVLGYAHLNETEVPTDLASRASASAIPFVSDDVRALYQTTLGRLELTPNAEFTTFRYGAGGAGAADAQGFDDRDVTTAGLAALYPLGDTLDAALAVQDVETDYLRRAPGAGSLSSNSWLLLGGIDDQGAGPWRYRLLAGVEQRDFADRAVQAETTPIAEASVTWQPVPLTALTATLTREVTDAAAAGVGSYTYTNLDLSLDRTLRHDLVFQCRTQIQLAEYQAGGTQRNYGAGATLTWTLSPRLRLQADYQYTTESAAPGAIAGAVSGGFSRNRIAISLHLAP